MAQFASDDFAGTSGTELSAYNSDWIEHGSYTSGNLVISDAGRVHRGGNTNPSVYYHSGTPASADYTVTSNFKAKTADGGSSFAAVIGRIDTADITYYMFRYAGGSTDSWELIKFVAGVATTLGTVSQAFADESTKEVKLSMDGSTIEGYVAGSGTPTISVTDSAISAAGKAGIRLSASSSETNTSGMHFEDFSADDIGGGGAPTISDLKAVNITATTVQGTYDYAF